MVIIRTSATEVKTQAVSPELPVHFSRTVAEQLGGAAGAAGAVAAGAAGAAGAAAGAAARRRIGVVLRHRTGRSEAYEHGRRQRGGEASQYSWQFHGSGTPNLEGEAAHGA